MTSIERGRVKTVGKWGLTTGSLEKSNEICLVSESGLRIMVLHPGWFQYHHAAASTYRSTHLQTDTYLLLKNDLWYTQST
jgi:hypothetical protein